MKVIAFNGSAQKDGMGNPMNRSVSRLVFHFFLLSIFPRT